jgi:hypothetical protein
MEHLVYPAMPIPFALAVTGWLTHRQDCRILSPNAQTKMQPGKIFNLSAL